MHVYLYGHLKDEREEADTDEDNTESNTLITRDPHSGYPSSLYEQTRELLQAGFSPLELPLLREKLYYILVSVYRAYFPIGPPTQLSLERFHIPIEMSAGAFIAPGRDVYHPSWSLNFS